MTDSDYEDKEQEIDQLFASERLDSTVVPNETRIEKIVDKALYESVVKDTASFVISSFSSAILGLTGAVLSVGSETKKNLSNP